MGLPGYRGISVQTVRYKVRCTLVRSFLLCVSATSQQSVEKSPTAVGDISINRWRYFQQPLNYSLFFRKGIHLSLTKIRLSGAYCSLTRDKISLPGCRGYFMRFRDHEGVEIVLFMYLCCKAAKIGCTSAKHSNKFDALRPVCTIFAPKQM